MKSYVIPKNPHFVGRQDEIARLKEITSRHQASFIVVYGRRRVGKTELVEQFFRGEMVFKFEGLELEENKTFESLQKIQINNCLKRLSDYLENPLLQKIICSSWTEFFELLNEVACHKNIVLYFEEIQWLASYQSHFFAELKPFWDDFWRHNKKFKLVICGSSTSFIVDQLLSSKAIYARVQEEFHLKEFDITETKAFLKNKGNKEVMLAQLAVGGISEYLNRLKGAGTVLSNLCKHSFIPSSFFSLEKDKIFVSSLSRNKYYKKIIEFLAKKKFADALEITKSIKGNARGGGSITLILEDLKRAGFIKKYNPIHKEERSKLVRYCLQDEYLQFYYKFIQPKLKKIEGKVFVKDPIKALNKKSFEIVMGFNFERWCQKNAHLFARILGFSGMEYEAGPFFDKKTQKEKNGVQIDLMYIIKGSKIVICEIKYFNGLVGNSVCKSIQEKIRLFQESQPKYKNYTYEAILITTEGVKDRAIIETVFDRVVTFDDIFSC